MANKNHMKELLEQYGRLNTNYRNSFHQGDIVQHFKRETINASNSPNEYLYKILCIAKHTEKMNIWLCIKSYMDSLKFMQDHMTCL